MSTIAALIAASAASDDSEGGGMHLPTLDELFPSPFVGDGTLWELNRIGLVRIVATLALVLLVWLGARRTKLVPGRGQSTFELMMGFVHKQICEAALSPAAARQYLPYIATLFFGIFALNITGVIPFLDVSSNSVVAVPLMLALCTWIAFVVAGIKAHGFGHFVADNLFPKGAPKVMYVILAPIEFLSTFILRPVTLTVRLMANMIAGHFLLAAFFAMTSYLFVEASGALKGLGVVSFAAAFAFTLFEIFVAALQAYIFSLLSTVYIGLAREGH
ncbi:MAG: F0F1 ATP synthase subunit A [Bifidobacteriaceae bacterium]|nr:F0F1 ATP synthase subunit A [Bifidobacteriaceae bacterium]